jgi:hypothetical protein
LILTEGVLRIFGGIVNEPLRLAASFHSLDLALSVLYVGPVDTMKPEDALQEQILRYRQMTGEQRLALALDLHELSCNIAREGIRHQNPQADEAEVERKLRQRLKLAWQ